MKDYSIYVTEEIAKKAMEMGFECRATTFFKKTPTEEQLEWIKDEDLFIKDINEEQPNVYKLPTAEQICGWLREEKNVEISIGRNELSDYPYKAIAYLKEKEDYAKVSIGYEYPNVLIEVINKALDLI